MPERAPERPAVFTIPAHRSFADALAAGLIQRFGKDPLGLARGRILLPNNRAVRAVTEAFVRASGSGLLLPRLIPIGDPELDERIGGALEPLDDAEPIPPAIDPLQRLLTLAELVRGEGGGSTEALHLAQDLARTLDLLLVEEVDPRRLADAGAEMRRPRRALASFARTAASDHRTVAEAIGAELGRNRPCRPPQPAACAGLRAAGPNKPPEGFTVAAGITTAAPAVTALLHRVARMPEGMVVVPALSLASVMPDEEWDALGPDEQGRGEETHPQYHLKLLLDRMGIARGEVQVWPASGRAASPAVRGARGRQRDDGGGLQRQMERAQAARAAADRRARRRVRRCCRGSAGDRLGAARALETPGQTAALVTPDRMLARRVSALLQRWGIEADDSAGRPLSETPAGNLAARDCGGRGGGTCAGAAARAAQASAGRRRGGRAAPLARDRADVRPRAARPTARGGRGGLDEHFASARRSRNIAAARRAVRLRPASQPIAGMLAKPLALGRVCRGALSLRRGGWQAIAPWRGRRRAHGRRTARRTRSCAGGGHDDDRGRGRRAGAPRPARAAARFGRPMAGIRAFSSGACSKRGCSRRT